MNIFVPEWLCVLSVFVTCGVLLFLLGALAYFLFEWAENLWLFYHGAKRSLDEVKQEISNLKCNRK